VTSRFPRRGLRSYLKKLVGQRVRCHLVSGNWLEAELKGYDFTDGLLWVAPENLAPAVIPVMLHALAYLEPTTSNGVDAAAD